MIENSWRLAGRVGNLRVTVPISRLDALPFDCKALLVAVRHGPADILLCNTRPFRRCCDDPKQIIQQAGPVLRVQYQAVLLRRMPQQLGHEFAE
ncbi:hypothetical protein D3C73_1495600 [compost metagenome]